MHCGKRSTKSAIAYFNYSAYTFWIYLVQAWTLRNPTFDVFRLHASRNLQKACSTVFALKMTGTLHYEVLLIGIALSSWRVLLCRFRIVCGFTVGIIFFVFELHVALTLQNSSSVLLILNVVRTLKSLSSAVLRIVWFCSYYFDIRHNI